MRERPCSVETYGTGNFIFEEERYVLCARIFNCCIRFPLLIAHTGPLFILEEATKKYKTQWAQKRKQGNDGTPNTPGRKAKGRYGDGGGGERDRDGGGDEGNASDDDEVVWNNAEHGDDYGANEEEQEGKEESRKKRRRASGKKQAQNSSKGRKKSSGGKK